jgi:transposase-like protein
VRSVIGPLADGGWIPDEVIDELLAGASTEEEIVGPGGLLAQLTKRLVERAMDAELTDYLGYEPHEEPPGGAGDTRNGGTPKTLITDHGPVRISTPRDRNGSFEPKLVRKGQRRFQGFDDKILALYSRGMSVRDIRAHLQEIYGVDVGRDLISRVTDAVMDDVREWANRPLEDVYPIVFLDCLVLKIREGGSVQRRACYLALGVTVEGDRDVLGMWFQEAEGAKFWMQVLSELKQRGVSDILICCVDGLTGFPEAIEAIFPKTTVQTCIVHLIRTSLKYVPRRERWPPSRQASRQTRPAKRRAQQARERRSKRSCLLGPPATAGGRHTDGRHDIVGARLTRRTALRSHPQFSSLRTAIDPVARRGPPMCESCLRARSSNQGPTGPRATLSHGL